MKPLTLISPDKALHFLVGFFICSLGCIFSPIIGLAAGILAGIAKELYDRYYEHETFDWLDLFATIAGAITAVTINSI